MPWFFIILFLTSTLSSLPEAGNLPSAVVIGSVSCDTCFEQVLTKKRHFIRGAIVSVECKDGKSRQSFHEKVKTDKHGVFRVHLPFSVSKHVQKIKTCSVVLLSNGGTSCAVASTATSSSLHLKSRKEGTDIFSAGFFSFKPQKQPYICNQKPRILNSREFNAKKASMPPVPGFNNPTFPPPLQDPKTPDFPPASPQLPPLPPLPSLPPLPGLPVLPPFPPFPGKDRKTKPTEFSESTKLSDQKGANPETFWPTPPYLPPNPFQPPPPFPPLLPPNPFQPPPSPLIPLPPIPGLTYPPPPPPAFPFPLPPFPFPLPPYPVLPRPPPIPGIPPASSSSTKNSP